tara:strand:- start:1364 stop:1738 length:375 start_codon:yes stop_codon:yes gene_type:complete
MGGGKAPAKTAEQKAMERTQREQLDKETASSERRLKAITQKQLGKASLLGTPMEQAEGPAGPTVTKGYQVTSSGGIRKIPKPKGGLFGRLLKSGLMGGAPAGMGIKSASLIGKGAEKSIKGAIK